MAWAAAERYGALETGAARLGEVMGGFQDRVRSRTARAALIDPPLGFVDLEVGDDTVSIAFSDGEKDIRPRSSVRALEHDDTDVKTHWAGTPVVLSFANPNESALWFDQLGGLDEVRAFTFEISESDAAAS